MNVFADQTLFRDEQQIIFVVKEILLVYVVFFWFLSIIQALVSLSRLSGSTIGLFCQLLVTVECQTTNYSRISCSLSLSFTFFSTRQISISNSKSLMYVLFWCKKYCVISNSKVTYIS